MMMKRVSSIVLLVGVVLVAQRWGPMKEQLEDASDVVKDGVETLSGKNILDVGRGLQKDIKNMRLEKALKEFESMRGRSPKDFEELVEEGLIQKDELIDQWGRSLQVEANSDGFRVRSAGPDGKYNTKDDWTLGG